MAFTFQAAVGEKFAPLIGLREDYIDFDTVITTLNTEVTEPASETLGKEVAEKKDLGHQGSS